MNQWTCREQGSRSGICSSGERGGLESSKTIEVCGVGPRSRPKQTTSRDVSVFVVMVRVFLRASLARHSENERRNDPGWWENANSQPWSYRRIPFETNSGARVQLSIKTPPWSPLLAIPFN